MCSGVCPTAQVRPTKVQNYIGMGRRSAWESSKTVQVVNIFIRTGTVRMVRAPQALGEARKGFARGLRQAVQFVCMAGRADNRVAGERTVSISKPFTSRAVLLGKQEVMELLVRHSSTRIGCGSLAWEYVWSCSLF